MSSITAIAGLLLVPVLLVPGALPEALQGAVPWIACVTMVWVCVLVRRPALRIAVGALALALVAGWRHAPTPTEAMPHLAGAAAGLLVLATFERWATSRARLAVLMVAVLVLSGAALIVGARSTTAPGDKGVPMVLSQIDNPPELPMADVLGQPFVNPNALGIAALMVLCLALAAAVAPQPPAQWHRWLRWTGLLVGAVAVSVMAITQSRGVALALIVAGLAGWWRLRPRWRHVALAATVVVGVGVAGLLLRDADVRTGTRASVNERWEQWTRAGALLAADPWRGIGLDAYRAHAPTQVHAHNIALQTALDLGVLGLAAYVAVMGLMLQVGIRHTQATGDPFTQVVAAGAVFALIVVHVYGVFDAVAIGTRIGTLQWMAGGLLLAATRPAEQERC